MKKLFVLLTGFLMFSCSSDGSQETPPPFILEASASSAAVNVDQEFTITIKSDKFMTGIYYSFDNFVTEAAKFSDFGNSATLKFNLDKLGTTAIYFKALSQEENFSTVKVVYITVNRGDAIKITGMQILSFDGINTSWDAEYPTSDINHLADVIFSYSKYKLNNPFENGFYRFTTWYTSIVKQNQENLTWSFANENLYIKPENSIRLDITDVDNPPLGQSLMQNDYRDFNFINYTTTKPNNITFSYPELNLEFIVMVEWPN